MPALVTNFFEVENEGVSPLAFEDTIGRHSGVRGEIALDVRLADRAFRLGEAVESAEDVSHEMQVRMGHRNACSVKAGMMRKFVTAFRRTNGCGGGSGWCSSRKGAQPARPRRERIAFTIACG